MSINQPLKVRLDKIVIERDDFYVQQISGGVGFLPRGPVSFGIFKEEPISGSGHDQADKALRIKRIKPFDITGRAMKGWVMVTPIMSYLNLPINFNH